MTAADSSTTYPLRIEGTLDPDLSRGLWLLAIPHVVILVFLTGWLLLL